jgi:hypothetical protein
VLIQVSQVVLHSLFSELCRYRGRYGSHKLRRATTTTMKLTVADVLIYLTTLISNLDHTRTASNEILIGES